MKARSLSAQDLARLKDCIKTTIAGRAKAINDSIDTYSTQYCWSIVKQ